MHVSVKASKSIRIHDNVSEMLRRNENRKPIKSAELNVFFGLYSEKRQAIEYSFLVETYVRKRTTSNSSTTNQFLLTFQLKSLLKMPTHFCSDVPASSASTASQRMSGVSHVSALVNCFSTLRGTQESWRQISIPSFYSTFQFDWFTSFK